MMTPIRNLALVSTVLAMLAACSAPEPTSPAVEVADATNSTVRVRGTVQSVTDGSLTVQTWDGRTVAVPVAATTRFVWVVASSLSTLQDGDFVGTATTGPKTALRALELVIFPESMRGAGEGHYAWDVPGVVASRGGGPVVSSAMTNGTVASQSAMTNGTVQAQSAMTNGTVAGSEASSGGRMLTISYEGGTANVTIPEGTPIVRFEPTERPSLAVGQKVYAVIPQGTTSAGFVAMGKDGVTPPM
ncbi:hypothetical protein [Brevundimonas sp.]|uniref:hypothetical protein n=1 Tax=Brevundimonas sp. TaxID=1871086 RepID=UPI0024889307|nr:hypothetical protein [Brevundimonas sp.]MDI1279824.1 hypothetical protein [Brevundimonas sp.]